MEKTVPFWDLTKKFKRPLPSHLVAPLKDGQSFAIFTKNTCVGDFRPVTVLKETTTHVFL